MSMILKDCSTDDEAADTIRQRSKDLATKQLELERKRPALHRL